ncbi:ABC transporter substrate-binding protein [Paenibacillus cremeus]|uniref:ABC transporter substrate-binding protein n=1 Tax=Paenibacillus cremeus TaxID=2163881 RepID=A0A559JRB5_9BACL|nr:ABC transporter substrate-binding protein [Paenibacillus cremeus]TVY02415.1 ABC transporter substrate-binding protein [Paenibacillus cremeus]
MKLKKWISAMAISSLMLTAVGCSSTPAGGAADEAKAPPPASDDKSPITIQYWHSHNDDQIKTLNYMIGEFQKKYPNITIEPVFQGGYPDLQNKLLAAVSAHNVPAVTNAEVSALPSMADGGMFADLTPYMKRDNFDLNDFSKGMLGAYAYNGKQYGLPLIVSAGINVYNKTLLDSLGLKPPQTWDEMEDFNKKVTVKENGKTTRYALEIPAWEPFYFDPWIFNSGGAILSADGKTSVLDQPANMKWILTFQRWMQEGSLQIGYGAGASDTMRQMFLNGQIAMVDHTSAVLKTYLQNAKFEVGVSFFPGDKQHISHMGGAGIVMMDGAPAKEKEAAWKFIQFMSDAEHNIKWAEGTGYLPTRKSVVNTEEGKAYFAKYPQYKVVFDNFDNVVGRPQHPKYQEFSKVYQNVVGQMVLNKADPTPLMKDAVKQINQILSDK